MRLSMQNTSQQDFSLGAGSKGFPSTASLGSTSSKAVPIQMFHKKPEELKDPTRKTST